MAFEINRQSKKTERLPQLLADTAHPFRLSLWLLELDSGNLLQSTGSQLLGFPYGSAGKESALPMQETWVRSLGWGDPLEKGKATHSSILAWRIPWTLKFAVSLTEVLNNFSHV